MDVREFFFCHVGVPQIKLSGSSGLVVGTFSHRAVLPVSFQYILGLFLAVEFLYRMVILYLAF